MPLYELKSRLFWIFLQKLVYLYPSSLNCISILKNVVGSNEKVLESLHKKGGRSKQYLKMNYKKNKSTKKYERSGHYLKVSSPHNRSSHEILNVTWRQHHEVLYEVWQGFIGCVKRGINGILAPTVFCCCRGRTGLLHVRWKYAGPGRRGGSVKKIFFRHVRYTSKKSKKPIKLKLKEYTTLGNHFLRFQILDWVLNKQGPHKDPKK